jgi:hypothetical protein
MKKGQKALRELLFKSINKETNPANKNDVVIRNKSILNSSFLVISEPFKTKSY